MRGIDKRFPGVHALKKCRLSLQPGEVLALVGENGAGKSTMMKILTGIYSEYEGEIILGGKPVRFATTREAQNAGISIVHQELNMLNQMTVAKNIFIGRESRGFFYNERKLNKAAQALIDEFAIHVRPTDIIANLSVGKMQMVEIARAMSFPETRVLVLDEPTAALSDTESKDLFAKMRRLKAQGVGIIFISHRMQEIMEIADRVTVMRDGEYVGALNTNECQISDIITLMVGRSIAHAVKEKSEVAPDAPVVLEASNLCSKVVKDVSFTLRKGEILGFAGLVGAGRTETMRLVFGADRMHSGSVRINGQPVVIRRPADAVRAGLGYLSEDRKRYGLVTGMSVTRNAVMASMDRFISHGMFISWKECRRETERYIGSLRIKTPGSDQLVRNLSGGNQQKVIIAKWLIRNCEILVFDEPTRGIDVGAKAEIYDLIRALAKQGKSIIMISSELPEVLHLCDRVVVMCEGRKTAEYDIADASQEKIVHSATQYADAEEAPADAV
ncbi:MAG: sugar ABC transporter ATP-binding protein [Planctomycetes bacterium]|nr:sugar ABC transporter ATP-binding protein [Planctomycetota bacterium]